MRTWVETKIKSDEALDFFDLSRDFQEKIAKPHADAKRKAFDDIESMPLGLFAIRIDFLGKTTLRFETRAAWAAFVVSGDIWKKLARAPALPFVIAHQSDDGDGSKMPKALAMPSVLERVSDVFVLANERTK